MTTRATPPGDPQPPQQKRRRAPRSVPVASRDQERLDKRAAKRRARTKPGLFQRDIASLAILISVLLLILMAIAVPLRNYYEGRGEIARAQASIDELEKEKSRLETDIARYQDKDFVDQEARRRLGVLAEGETEWRIIDPRMSQGQAITSEETPVVDDRSWNQVLWDSLREADAPTDEQGAPAGGAAAGEGGEGGIAPEPSGQPVPGSPSQPAPQPADQPAG